MDPNDTSPTKKQEPFPPEIEENGVTLSINMPSIQFHGFAAETESAKSEEPKRDLPVVVESKSSFETNLLQEIENQSLLVSIRAKSTIDLRQIKSKSNLDLSAAEGLPRRNSQFALHSVLNEKQVDKTTSQLLNQEGGIEESLISQNASQIGLKKSVLELSNSGLIQLPQGRRHSKSVVSEISTFGERSDLQKVSPRESDNYIDPSAQKENNSVTATGLDLQIIQSKSELKGDSNQEDSAAGMPLKGQNDKSSKKSLLMEEYDDEGTADDSDASSVSSEEVYSETEDFYHQNFLLFDLEQTPAFKTVDKMVADGKVNHVICADIKNVFKAIHLVLIKCKNHEKALTNQVSRLEHEIESQRLDITKRGTKQFLDGTVIGDKRRQLVKIRNELHLITDRGKKMANDIMDLNREKYVLVKEIKTIQRQKADMLEPQLISETKDLKAEITHKNSQSELIQKDLEEKELLLEGILRAKLQLEKQRDHLAQSLHKNNDVPLKLMKHSEMNREAIKVLLQEEEKLENMMLAIEEEIEELNTKKKSIEQIKQSKASEYERKRVEVTDMERQCEEISKRHEMVKEHLNIQKSEQVRMTLQLQSLAAKSKKDQEATMKAMREREVNLKAYRKNEQQVNNLQMVIPLLKRQQDDLKSSMAVMKKDEDAFAAQLETLKKELDMAMYAYLKQSNLEKEDEKACADMQTQNRQTQTELEHSVKKVNELHRKYEEANADKQLRIRELTRLQTKYHSIENDLRIKQEMIHDASMECQDAFVQLQNFIKLYEVVKTERNKFLAMIQSANQHIAELKDKGKVIQNEIEILRLEATNKDRELIRKEQENANLYGVRDKVKNESNKMHSEYRQKRDRIDENIAQSDKLNMTITITEEDLARIKRLFTETTSERNILSKMILDRHDELCVLYEKTNQNEAIIKTKSDYIASMEEQIRKYGIIKMNVMRENDQLKQRKPLVKKLHRVIRRLELAILQRKKQIHSLASLVENPLEEGRSRILPGTDLNEEDLIKKIQELENGLATKEERLIEKDLILDEVTALTEKLRLESLEKRSESTIVYSKLNHLSKQIKKLNISLMARASELAMVQANSFHLQSEREEKEAILEKAKDAFQSGTLDIQEFEAALLRAQRNKVRREREMMEMQEKQNQKERIGVDMDDEGFYLIKEVRTKAIPRPNAYMPDKMVPGELPIPKAYGKYSPFKPVGTKHHLKFYKKQIIKPVEI